MALSQNKAKYESFVGVVYTPIYSQPWWMDSICGVQNWDVWLFEQGGEVVAAMPYYLEDRSAGRYITKAPLTQNNGIIFKYPDGAGFIAKAKFEEKVINAACDFVEDLGLAVYEQQYQTTFVNHLPFHWRGFSAIPRYTYLIEETGDLEKVWGGLSSSYRKNVKKGKRNGVLREDLEPELFYKEHAKVFERQGLSVPFSESLWSSLHAEASRRGRCKTLAATVNGEIASVLFLVWDDRSVYHLMGGTMPGYGQYETYNSLTWRGIELAHEKGLAYDFEGSMIERISKSFREFGGVPKQYFRIRKVFSPEVIEREAHAEIARLDSSV